MLLMTAKAAKKSALAEACPKMDVKTDCPSAHMNSLNRIKRE